ncbi:MAG: WXG100 family type VII secretion target [Anaerolineae bacterium]|nr:WXG100 family type VII secretion target [Anaerolineae bacterium]
MADQTIVNYDLLSQFEKVFDTQQEETSRDISELRQKAQALESEWIGQAADKFFDEFYEELMPGMDRLRHAFQITAEVLKKIARVFDEAENEGAQYFREDSLEGGDGGIDVTGLDFNTFGGIGGTTPESGGIDATRIDFNAFDGIETGGSGGGGGQSGGEQGTSGQGQVFDNPQDQPSEFGDQSQSGGMAGGGGGGSQGGGNDQLRMGVGTGNQVGTAGQETGGGSGSQMEDHIYESGGGGGGGQQSQNQAAQGAGQEGTGDQQGGSVLGAAGAVGGMAAAAGSIRNAGKRKKEDE